MPKARVRRYWTIIAVTMPNIAVRLVSQVSLEAGGRWDLAELAIVGISRPARAAISMSDPNRAPHLRHSVIPLAMEQVVVAWLFLEGGNRCKGVGRSPAPHVGSIDYHGLNPAFDEV